MLKRVLLMVISVLALGSVSAGAVSMEELEPLVREQFEAYTATLDAENAVDQAQDDMIRHAKKGASAELIMDEDDAMTTVVLCSELVQYTFPEIAARTIARMQNRSEYSAYLRGAYNWYSYGYTAYHKQYEQVEQDGVITDRVKATIYSSTELRDLLTPNACDDTMELLGGTTVTYMTFQEVSRENGFVTYDVSVLLRDKFNFDGDYSHAKEDGKDTTKAEMLVLIGKLLGLTEFSWSVEAEFQLTVPAKSCDHGSHAYHWTYDSANKELISSGEDGFCLNGATKLGEVNSEGKPTTPYFRLDEPVILRHDKPWVLEIEGKGSMTLVLSQEVNISDRAPYLIRSYRNSDSGVRKYDQTFFIGEFHYLTEAEKAQEEELAELKSVRDYYGVDFTEQYKPSAVQTYRLENRIAEDGSNTVWLLVDGVEAGPMVNYYQWRTLESGHINFGVQSDWISGQDFYINYISNNSCRMPSNTRSVTIWENGQDDLNGSAYGETAVAPTCTEQGYTLHTCLKCGDYYRDNYVDSLGGHTLERIPAVEPTCTADGNTEDCRCTVCGTVFSEWQLLEALGHEAVTDPAVPATCTEEGLTEGSHCGRCGEVLVPQTAVPAVGHKSDGVTNCRLESRCEVCGLLLREAGTHIWQTTVTVEPTCTENGVISYRCENCDAEMTGSNLALGHQYEVTFCWSEDLTEATAEAVCTRCGTVTEVDCTVRGSSLDNAVALLTAEAVIGTRRVSDQKKLTAVRTADGIAVTLPAVPDNVQVWAAGYDRYGAFTGLVMADISDTVTQLELEAYRIGVFFLNENLIPVYPRIPVR